LVRPTYDFQDVLGQ